MALRRSAEALFKIFENNVQYMMENRDEVPTEDFDAFQRAMQDLSSNHEEFRFKYQTIMKRGTTKKSNEGAMSPSASIEMLATELSSKNKLKFSMSSPTLLTAAEQSIALSKVESMKEFEKKMRNSIESKGIASSPSSSSQDKEILLMDSNSVELMNMHYSSNESRLNNEGSNRLSRPKSIPRALNIQTSAQRLSILNPELKNSYNGSKLRMSQVTDYEEDEINGKKKNSVSSKFDSEPEEMPHGKGRSPRGIFCYFIHANVF